MKQLLLESNTLAITQSFMKRVSALFLFIPVLGFVLLLTLNVGCSREQNNDGDLGVKADLVPPVYFELPEGVRLEKLTSNRVKQYESFVESSEFNAPLMICFSDSLADYSLGIMLGYDKFNEVTIPVNSELFINKDESKAFRVSKNKNDALFLIHKYGGQQYLLLVSPFCQEYPHARISALLKHFKTENKN